MKEGTSPEGPKARRHGKVGGSPESSTLGGRGHVGGVIERPGGSRHDRVLQFSRILAPSALTPMGVREFVPFCIPPAAEINVQLIFLTYCLLLSIQSCLYLKWPSTLHRAHLCLSPSSYRFAFNLAAISFAMHLNPGPSTARMDHHQLQ